MRFSQRRAPSRARRRRIASSGCVHRRSRRKLRDHGRRSGARFPRERRDRQCRQLSQRRHVAGVTIPRRNCERQRPEHGRADLHGDGEGGPQHSQYGQQIARRDGLYARRRRQSYPASGGRIDIGDHGVSRRQQTLLPPARATRQSHVS